MDINTKKLELLEWLLHVEDSSLLSKVEDLKSSFKKNEKNNQPVFGRLKGLIEIKPDFDAPLEDFKDYM